MNVELKIVNESDFEKNNSQIVFNAEHPRCYGFLFDENFSFKIGWQSSKIIPKINKISRTVYSVGIDLSFAMIDFEKNLILLNLTLDYFFYEIKENKGFVYVITELSIIKIDMITFKISETFPLPDFFQEIKFDTNFVEVKCSNDDIVSFPL